MLNWSPKWSQWMILELYYIHTWTFWCAVSDVTCIIVTPANHRPPASGTRKTDAVCVWVSNRLQVFDLLWIVSYFLLSSTIRWSWQRIMYFVCVCVCVCVISIKNKSSTSLWIFFFQVVPFFFIPLPSLITKEESKFLPHFPGMSVFVSVYTIRWR